MRIQPLRADQLTPNHLEAWRAILELRPTLDSPYFCPEFTLLAAKVRPNVEVAVLTEAGEHVGFFPFERRASRTAEPVASVLSDYQGVIAKPGVNWSASELLKASGLKVWNFHHLIITEGEEFQAGYWPKADALSMDLSQGFEAYRLAQRQAGAKQIKHVARRKRKLERELGRVSIETDCSGEKVFQSLLQWKSGQYGKHGLTNLFAKCWIEDFLRSIWRERDHSFRGRLFALYADGELLAAEFAMQAGFVLHSWFPVYNPRFAKYGAGHVLRQEMAQAAPSLGIRRIDLGKDEEPFKRSIASQSIPIAEGSLDLNPVRQAMKRHCRLTVHWLKSTRMGHHLRPSYRRVRKLLRGGCTLPSLCIKPTHCLANE